MNTPTMSSRRCWAVARQKDRRWRTVHLTQGAAVKSAEKLARRLGGEFLVYRWSETEASANYFSAHRSQGGK